MTNREIVSAFFTAYGQHQPAEMCRWLHPDVEFTDLAFENLTGERLRSMWHWFCVPFGARKKAINVPEFQITGEDGDRVEARYRVCYELEDGRYRVDYWIASSFALQNNLIVRQVDRITISRLQFAWMTKGPLGVFGVLIGKFDRGLKEKMVAGLDTFLVPAQVTQSVNAGRCIRNTFWRF